LDLKRFLLWSRFLYSAGLIRTKGEPQSILDRRKLIDRILNYLPVSEKLATGGQPTEDQIRSIAEAGFEVVINLGLHDTEYALPNEGSLVREVGMEYIYLPVDWENPTRERLLAFIDVMEENSDRVIFLHCAANMRVSIFLALFRILRDGWSPDQALQDVMKIWVPNPIWIRFFETVLLEGDT
jgi:protein tyrosine phosphatase (PTP) superfamily phosphohydrolase (DUF442 family)